MNSSRNLPIPFHLCLIVSTAGQNATDGQRSSDVNHRIFFDIKHVVRALLTSQAPSRAISKVIYFRIKLLIFHSSLLTCTLRRFS